MTVAMKKGPVLIRRPDEAAPLAMGMCYLATRTAPSGREQAGGTISQLEWAPGTSSDQAGPGRYQVEFSDGALVEIVVSSHLQTACGPDVLRFRAIVPAAADTPN